MEYMEKETKELQDERKEAVSSVNYSGHRWRVAAVVMLIVNIILLASILAVTITWRNERGREPTYMKQEQEMCLPCEDVYHHPDDLRDNLNGFMQRMEGDKDMCCGSASKHLDQLVALYAEKAHQKKRNTQMLLSSPYTCKKETESLKPSAHLVGVTKSVQDMHHHHMLKWNETCHLSKINGVVHDNGKLRVNVSGFYHIYSQITYQDQKDVFSYNENDIVLHHSIHKEYNGDDITREKLLESTQSQCQFVGDKVNKTSYIGAIFYLKVNDNIHVRVSHPHKILLSQHGNYFGMYLT